MNDTWTRRLRAGPTVWRCGVRAEREFEGLSLRALAAAVPGLTVTTLRRIEAGCDVPLTTATKLAGFFGCRVEDLWFPPDEGEVSGE